MSDIRNYIRYSSQARKIFYKLLKFLDNLPVYKQLYHSHIEKRASIITPFPLELSIETTNLCNARCTICAHPVMKRPKGKMPTELVSKLIDEAAVNNVRKIFLSGFGEPLIDKRIPEFVAYAKKQGIDNIAIVTNGFLLTPDLAERLIESGLNEIIISIDGFTRKTYESIRLNLKFDKLVENIQALANLPNRRKAHISISCVDLVHNSRERDEAHTVFGPYVDAIYFRQAQDWTGVFSREEAGYSPHFGANSIPCRYLWESLSVYIDGTVPACCLDYEAEGVLGNATEKTIAEIWQDKTINHYRRCHLDGRKSELSPCKKCGYYSVWW